MREEVDRDFVDAVLKAVARALIPALIPVPWGQQIVIHIEPGGRSVRVQHPTPNEIIRRAN